jgi:hypothetical protein
VTTCGVEVEAILVLANERDPGSQPLQYLSGTVVQQLPPRPSEVHMYTTTEDRYEVSNRLMH